MTTVFKYLYITVCIGDVIAILGEYTPLRYIVTPLLMITLIGYYIAQSQSHQNSISPLVVVSLLFSCTGDWLILLMYMNGNPNYFMYGLIAFLMAHVLYIVTFRQHRFEKNIKGIISLYKTKIIVPTTIIIIYLITLVVLMYPNLNELQIPVYIYATIIGLMAITALLRYGATSHNGFIWVFFGASLFLLSDSILATNRFISSVWLEPLWSMIIYMIAQYSIVTGLTKHN